MRYIQYEGITVGTVTEWINAARTRILKYTVEISHNGLKEHKVISAPEEDILENKVSIQLEKWNEKWQIQKERKKRVDDRTASIEQANELTYEAQETLQEIDDMLSPACLKKHRIDWEKLKKFDEFSIPKPGAPLKRDPYIYPNKPNEPYRIFTFTEKVFKKLREKKNTYYDNLSKEQLQKWNDTKESIDEKNRKIEETHQKAIEEWKNEVAVWEKQKEAFLDQQKSHNGKIDQWKQSYLSSDPDAVTNYCDLVLSNMQFPDTFSIAWQLEYNSENRILIVEFQLPSIDDFPKVKEVKYVASKNELRESLIPESQLSKLFESAIYKMTLRVLHELFTTDEAGAIDSISFNGWINSINKATGKEENNCILSLQARKPQFLEISLDRVEPKECFKSLKGVSASKLSALTPIAPILQISNQDKRFVDSYAVAHNIDDRSNLAAMEWEDFEHLIRELFEKEFMANGGEVRITQASRDGGVDAIAFDPDPIRGGKIVIQAKRYTNTVGVAAVRDLYGTTINEGANKGILVSTADYGPDAYEFAKGKPLSLLNGNNLLFLLEKHGYHAKIDLKEAKRINAELKDT